MYTRGVALSAAAVIVALSAGCVSSSASPDAHGTSGDSTSTATGVRRPRRGSSKFDQPNARRFPEYTTLDEAKEQVGFTPRTPRRVGKLVKAVVHDRGYGKALSREDRPMDLHYADFWIAQAPYSTHKEAAENLDMVMSRSDADLYMHEVSVHGMRALAHDPVDMLFFEDGKDEPPTGQLVIDGASVIWADGKMFYNVTSDTLPYSELLLIAESMYE